MENNKNSIERNGLRKVVIKMNETRRLINKALPPGWSLRKNSDVQDGSQYGYKWAIHNQYGRIVYVGKTLDRIREQLEGVNDYVRESIEGRY